MPNDDAPRPTVTVRVPGGRGRKVLIEGASPDDAATIRAGLRRLTLKFWLGRLWRAIAWTGGLAVAFAGAVALDRWALPLWATLTPVIGAFVWRVLTWRR
jgi:hypothetical protein